ncbi:MAG: hypothetical protein SGBAC_009843 [Bacillariaceae sp.]
MRASQAAKPGPPLPQLYIDTISAAFGEEVDLHREILGISPDALPIEQRIAYFKRGREIMKQADSPISAPKDLPALIRARLKATNMAYDIVSNPEWHRQYLTRKELPSPRIKSGVRFNEHIQEHVYELDPLEEEYLREKRERRMQRLQALADDSLSHESFWNDLLKDMDSFQLGLDGFLQAFPDPISGQELQEALTDDSSFPDTQSFSSWISGSYTKKAESTPDDDMETTSYMSSFNPFAEEAPRESSRSNDVRSPTSLPQELAEMSQVPRDAQKKQTRNTNPFRGDIPPSSNPYSENDDTTSLFSDGPLDISPVTSPFDDEDDDDDDDTNPFEDEALNVTLDDAPDDASNPFSEAASDSRFSIGTFQKRQKERRAHRSIRSSNNSQISNDLSGAFDDPKVSAILDEVDGSRSQPQSTNPFEDEPNHDVSGDATSVFDGLDELWDNEGVHVDGESVISDLSASVVAKTARQKQQAFKPFENNLSTVKEGTRGSSSDNSNDNNKASSTGSPNWGGTEQEQIGFSAAASAIAACCANIVADCQRNTEAIANMEMKNFTTIDFPNMFTAEESETPQLEQDPFDEMEELFNEMGDELNDELGEF